MAITHSNTSPYHVRNAMADAAVDGCDTGTGTPALLLLDGTSTVVTIDLATPEAFSDASSAQASIVGTPTGTAGSTGTVDTFKIQDRDGNDVFSGTVGTTTSADLQMSSVNLSSGEKVEVNTFNYTAPQ